ncbi:galactosyl transferase CpsE [Anaerocolumna cellulosilytica]|uniref:Galactosyl transferase CpsE n=1 Tax=Anaerocolumna cellulosilytica TaxID=433286 RepID=A0A6S6RB70_9FIRM|nr:sugar transferase [Anaerocolumna cellulosilytica]MBB5195267.1 exopolysaccharide biosynthesis polyprenyl glycosylphosphotransferase [Anaerocolumna cellulosilytica]BCJ96740.1 galactosyl transferase CpsE [Anaerocolumna cellulosilytica]
MGNRKSKVGEKLIIVVDIVSIIGSFILSVAVQYNRIGTNDLTSLYVSTVFIMLLSHMVSYATGMNRKQVFKRGFTEEGFAIVKEQVKLMAILVTYLYLTKQGESYSRLFVVIFFLLNYLITYVLRSYLKVFMFACYKRSTSSNKVLLITTSDRAEDVIHRIRAEREWAILISDMAIIDKDMVGECIEGITVLGSKSNLMEIARLNVLDEVFISLPQQCNFNLNEAIYEFEKMGVVVHIGIEINPMFHFKNKYLENFAGYQVITFSTGIFDARQELLKRVLDFAGGIIGVVATAIITLLLAPIIKLDSKGPVFFSQVRVGRNGRKFKIYKFRSMYENAEEMKKDLLDKNDIQGFMFKMKDDPRITKVGKFIRKTSLDEFPQFLNVLKGDMSLVGTRPPTLDEFEKYEVRHKRRLSLRPGLTGLWQVSGRSDIQDFEEVVKLDLEYIDNWSIGLDIKLILKTICVVVLKKGGR